jgi:uncharacterized cofD-like protein
MKKLNVVTVGGGSGGYIVDHGLSFLDINLTSITTSFDSGGSSGKLIGEFGVLPPGDVRRRILAQSKDDTEILKELFSYRFPEVSVNGKNSSLGDHSLGNLILVAAEKIWGKEKGIKKVCEIFQTVGEVKLVSNDFANLCAEMSNGKIIKGETNIDKSKKENIKIKKIFLDKKVFSDRSLLEKIENADYIIFCPGDLYTSLIPHFLVENFRNKILNSKAKIIYIMNLMTKFSETNNFKVSNFILEIENYLGKKPDLVLFNNTFLPKNILEKYRKEEKAELIENDILENLNFKNIKMIETDLISENAISQKIIRHSSEKIGKNLQNIFNKKIFIWDLDDTLINTSEVISEFKHLKDRNLVDKKDFSKFLEKIKVYKTAKKFIQKDKNNLHYLVSFSKFNKKFQQQKIIKVGLNKVFKKDNIFLVEEENEKEKVFEKIVNTNFISEKNIFIVGDNSKSELKIAKKMNLNSVRVFLTAIRKDLDLEVIHNLNIYKEKDFEKLEFL